MPSYTITVNGLEISFKTDADFERIQVAQALLEERFSELSKGGRYISREKLLTLLALGMADDYLETRRKLAALEARMQELWRGDNRLDHAALRIRTAAQPVGSS